MKIRKAMNVKYDITEAMLETMIFENRHIIHERGFPRFYRNASRQVVLPSGKIMDIITYEVNDNVLNVRVIELKKDLITVPAILQALYYMDELNLYACNAFDKVNWDIVVVGSSIDADGFTVASFLIQHLKALDYKFDFNGLAFGNDNQYDINFSMETKEEDYLPESLMAGRTKVLEFLMAEQTSII